MAHHSDRQLLRRPCEVREWLTKESKPSPPIWWLSWPAHKGDLFPKRPSRGGTGINLHCGVTKVSSVGHHMPCTPHTPSRFLTCVVPAGGVVFGPPISITLLVQNRIETTPPILMVTTNIKRATFQGITTPHHGPTPLDFEVHIERHFRHGHVQNCCLTRGGCR